MNELYQAIMARHSTRRYAKQPLAASTLDQVREIIADVRPLVANNHFQVLIRDVAQGEDLAAAFGGYGRIVSPPHYLVPYIVGEALPLTDLGYRVEQIAVRLTGLGIGSCYVGSLGREDAVRARFGLPEEARIGAFLIYGSPAIGLGGRAVNAAIRRVAGATNKLPATRTFFDGTFDHPGAPPEDLAPLIEAARHAPSAANAQPWRFLWHDRTLYILVQQSNPRYGAGHADYGLYDGGICMGNVSLALEAMGQTENWELLAENDPGLPDHPAGLQPLARLHLLEQEAQ
jgi:nitroreductase